MKKNLGKTFRMSLNSVSEDWYVVGLYKDKEQKKSFYIVQNIKGDTKIIDKKELK
jgi:hypothetical protein